METLTERIELRLTTAQKELLQRAAEALGISLKELMLRAAQPYAAEVLAETHSLQLSRTEQLYFLAALTDPQPPTEALARLRTQWEATVGHGA